MSRARCIFSRTRKLPRLAYFRSGRGLKRVAVKSFRRHVWKQRSRRFAHTGAGSRRFEDPGISGFSVIAKLDFPSGFFLFPLFRYHIGADKTSMHPYSNLTRGIPPPKSAHSIIPAQKSTGTIDNKTQYNNYLSTTQVLPYSKTFKVLTYRFTKLSRNRNNVFRTWCSESHTVSVNRTRLVRCTSDMWACVL